MLSDPHPILVDDHAAARALGLSVSWLRHDRRGKRLIPFTRLGGAVRYDLAHVRQAVADLEEGGRAPRARDSKR